MRSIVTLTTGRRHSGDGSPLPSRRWVECAKWIEHKSLDDGNTDAQEWAADHMRLYVGHDRYRIVSQVGFSLAPTAAP
ncbi:hypothetical protein [Streptomyces turgidiscabies]|uniref:Transposase n=1 Tax=Streptomyces turgidiscabies TaxID=85558 RepID=A0ABU0RW09_9ACTN|nr:hypothetical protein [Streptomyces turgidiscabies]MDQ0936003.1 hypothetical protein [Streptomyces turgidiscabies]